MGHHVSTHEEDPTPRIQQQPHPIQIVNHAHPQGWNALSCNNLEDGLQIKGYTPTNEGVLDSFVIK